MYIFVYVKNLGGVTADIGSHINKALMICDQLWENQAYGLKFQKWFFLFYLNRLLALEWYPNRDKDKPTTSKETIEVIYFLF